MPSLHFEFNVTTGLAAIATIGYIVSRARRREGEFSMLDGLLLVILMSIATAGGITLVEAASQSTRVAALRENLRVFRTQIEAYKLQHGGEPPLLFEGSFIQLTQATDAGGLPGRVDAQHPYGPYFRNGLPMNTVTGKDIVTATDSFPPSKPSGHGGWLYHQQTGKIVIDLPEYLNE